MFFTEMKFTPVTEKFTSELHDNLLAPGSLVIETSPDVHLSSIGKHFWMASLLSSSIQGQVPSGHGFSLHSRSAVTKDRIKFSGVKRLDPLLSDGRQSLRGFLLQTNC